MVRDKYKHINALVFDVGGTVFDWFETIRLEIDALAAERGTECDASSFALDWRGRMLELLEQMRTGSVARTNADGLHRLALDDISLRYPGLSLTTTDLDQLNNVWHRLRVWSDFPPALAHLRKRYTVIVLTILSWAIVVDSSRANGLSWDGILSCEFLDAYKPEPNAYVSAAKLLRLKPEEVMMVSAHSGDLRAAASAGLRSAYVSRPLETGGRAEAFGFFSKGDGLGEDLFDLSVTSYDELDATLR